MGNTEHRFDQALWCHISKLRALYDQNEKTSNVYRSTKKTKNYNKMNIFILGAILGPYHIKSFKVVLLQTLQFYCNTLTDVSCVLSGVG